MDSGSILSIDIGSVSISVIQMDFSGKVLKSLYTFHKGQVNKCLSDLNAEFPLSGISGIACTKTRGIFSHVAGIYDPQLAIIKATKKMCPEARSVLYVGAEKFMVICFDKNGKYEYTKTNSSCASGTGSFLDQQTYRLHLSGIEELCELSLKNQSEIPDIASRCVVFAKTDLIHAQQKGFSLEAICDSLCKGLARNITNTLFSNSNPVLPMLMAGGVSRNLSVVRYIENQLNINLIVHPHSHFLACIGAGYLYLEELKEKELPALISINALSDIFIPEKPRKEFFHPPLSLQLSQYPAFNSTESYIYKSKINIHSTELQVDIYEHLNENSTYSVYLGIDIGSTSTKAVIMDDKKLLLAGFYTYTAGMPLSAVQLIFECLHEIRIRKGIEFSFKGVGTTGSGRNFIGMIINADHIIDEITTHARAAFELNPETDTIIEIGGQDAKFTLMKDGIVTFSNMNAVCAAGTGSFIEEQAKKLDCPLEEYSVRAEGYASPLVSDTCTVYMERDINHFLNQGYSVNEILASALFSVMENYLKKVATEGLIGKHIAFQGATAKNKALVAAFEQRLKRKIYVSRYCHLTGALGVALMLSDERINQSSFKGISLYRERITVESEICELCSNNCQISLATVRGLKVAYGFLCGRDYDSKRPKKKDPEKYDLFEARRKIFADDESNKKDLIIGIPATLYMYEELVLWKRFFKNLGIYVISSENFQDAIKTGKKYAGAEFCAPVDSLFGHTVYLSGKADYIFLPVFLQARDKIKETESNYCYYSQYSSSLIYTLKDQRIRKKMLSPFLDFNKGSKHIIRELYNCLKVIKQQIKLSTVECAYMEAQHYEQECRHKLIDIYLKEFKPESSLSVVLLGRPYVVLSRTLSKGIPQIFSDKGVKTFYQDMIPDPENYFDETDLSLKKVPWHFAANILKTARITACIKNLYPVLVTAFKCAPDSFIIEYFKKIMNHYNKPYLILQIDDHDSNMGYETRIEAALRSFRNHSMKDTLSHSWTSHQIIPEAERELNGKTLLFPGWDPIVSPLIVANLNRAGIDTRLLESSDIIIRKSLEHNTGQCLPLNIITREFIEYVEKYNLKPEKTALWMPDSRLSCNLRLYPNYIKSLLLNYGKGFEKASVYCGQITHLEISLSSCYYAYFAYMLGGLIRKTGCKIRPYESVKGSTDNAIQKSVKILEEAFAGKKSLEKAISESISLFESLERSAGNKPKVAIFGDFYVRDNDLMNQDLIHAIEDAGGEVVTTPYSDLVKMNIENSLRRSAYRGNIYEAAFHRLIINIMKFFDDQYYNKYFRNLLGNKPVINPLRLEKHLADFNISLLHSGESYENILKIFCLMENYPDISLFVQTNPAYCCPSLVTEAMMHEIKRLTGVPVVTLTYDGTCEYQNDIIKPYLLCGAGKQSS